MTQIASARPNATPKKATPKKAPDKKATLKSRPLIEARHISFQQNQNRILHDVSLSIAPGEILSLIGPNGAGKSTLIHILLGLLKPDAGKISRQENLALGYVPQKLHIDETLPLSVERFLSLTRRHEPEEIVTALDLTGIGHLGEQPINALSGGEYQRALLARAFLGTPQLMVLDEPVQGVDVGGRALLYELILSIRNRLQCAVLLVSHDLDIVMAQTDRVVCLNNHICCSGPPSSVVDMPAYQSLFGESLSGEPLFGPGAPIALYQHHGHQHKPQDKSQNGGKRAR